MYITLSAKHGSVYMLYQLKRAGFSQKDLVKMYVSIMHQYWYVRALFRVQVCQTIYHIQLK